MILIFFISFSIYEVTQFLLQCINQIVFVNINSYNSLESLRMQQQLKCSLHSEPFTLYCDQCLQLICHKCTILGPHNSGIHSVCQLPRAYQRRVEQINTRLNVLGENRDVILNQLQFLINSIESIKSQKRKIDAENEKTQSRMDNNLTKAFDNIVNLVSKAEEGLYEQINSINDLGHDFQSLGGHVETIISYPTIINEMKQVCDKIQILLSQSPDECIPCNLPKELTQLRLKLKQMDTLDAIYKKKKQTIRQMTLMLCNDLKMIEVPPINYEGYFSEIQNILAKYDGQGLVCYFCGVIMNDQSVNTICKKNQLNEQINKISWERGGKGEMLEGYGSVKPENAKFGTHKHHFGSPKDENIYYRIVFIDQIAQKSEQNEKDELYREIGEIYDKVWGQSNQTFFSFYLDNLLLKIKTLQKIKKKQLSLLFSKQDPEKAGYCDKIGLEYIMMEIIGLSEKETEIVKAILKIKNSQQFYNYLRLLEKLDSFYI